MKLLHLSDLHLGKRLGEFSLAEDQAWVLEQILRIAQEERPHAVLIAGDVYDKASPPAEAVAMFDDFLVRLAGLGAPVFVISGNHDSPERISFGARLIRGSGVYLSPVYDGNVVPVTLTDEFGPVDVYLLPFVRAVQVRRFFPEEEILTQADAASCAVRHMKLRTDRRNVLVTHLFVTGAQCCESEELYVGGSSGVPASVFDAFDYTALGHLHGPQNVGRRARYSGAPLKYSFSEAGQEKSVTIAELGKKGACSVRTRALDPLRDLVEIKGTYMEVTARDFYRVLDRNAFFHITLTDETDIPDAVGKLRAVYPNLMKLEYDNRRTREKQVIGGAGETQMRTPMDLFSELFEKQNNKPLTDRQREHLERLIRSIWEESE